MSFCVREFVRQTYTSDAGLPAVLRRMNWRQQKETPRSTPMLDTSISHRRVEYLYRWTGFFGLCPAHSFALLIEQCLDSFVLVHTQINVL